MVLTLASVHDRRLVARPQRGDRKTEYRLSVAPRRSGYTASGVLTSPCPLGLPRFLGDSRLAPKGNAVKDFSRGKLAFPQRPKYAKKPDSPVALLITSQSERNLAYVSQEAIKDCKNKQDQELPRAGGAKGQQGMPGRGAQLVAL
jgi:hypothetical protein